jgi:acyl-CoA thioesterase-1
MFPDRLKIYRAHLLRLLLICSGGVLALTPAQAAPQPTLLIVGDSISAAYGMEPRQGWVTLLQEQLQANPATRGIAVVNASISGETSSGGLQRLPALLQKHQPQWLILELGGNDGLRGYPLPQLRNNLQAMIDMGRAQGSQMILVGMQIPPNYGARYSNQFAEMYPQLAAAYQLPLVPQWLQPLAARPDLLQADGIHPTAAAQPQLLAAVWEQLQPLLQNSMAAGAP